MCGATFTASPLAVVVICVSPLSSPRVKTSGQRCHWQRSELRGKSRPVQPQVLASNEPVAEGEDVQQPHAYGPPLTIDAERLALGSRLPKHLVDQDVVAVVAV